jgi:hypothetical protein
LVSTKTEFSDHSELFELNSNAGDGQKDEQICAGFFLTSPNAAGAEMPARVTKKGKKTTVNWDGVDLLPYLRGEDKDPPHEVLFWRMVMRGQAVREGKWKLLLNVHTPPALYDLSADISEQKNLYSEEPEAVARLWGKLNAWEESLEDTPHWVEDPYWQGYNRKLYQQEYWLTRRATRG